MAERHIRPLTIGRKNFMFSTSVAGAKANSLNAVICAPSFNYPLMKNTSKIHITE
ncbi:IS66 family transposase [Listeria monocytogenes]|uniref:IS66 family transposase n=1 Tax=Listeria monocytogenes TaxID=1639 RepID=UPI00190F3952